jgi:hypothetical protein
MPQPKGPQRGNGQVVCHVMRGDRLSSPLSDEEDNACRWGQGLVQRRMGEAYQCDIGSDPLKRIIKTA